MAGKRGIARSPWLLTAFAMALATSCNAGGERPQPHATPPAATAAPRVALASWPVPEALPGGEPLPTSVRAKMARALTVGNADEEPRTRHLRPDGSPQYTNRLILEASPYLRQHAHNPVDWRPWGDEAFEEARRLGRPVFLSIGYSTCHWCHVMERESFEDEEIARVLNSRFVPIKVDREERPDVDAVYMAVVQMLTGGGGWPMTLVLTPDREPFFGGTYFPARRGDRGSRAGLLEILTALADRYERDPDEVVRHATQITERLRSASQPHAPEGVPDATPILSAKAALAQTYDARWGGFGGPPKFPRTVALELLLRAARRTGDARARTEVLETLDRIARGGIHDQIGGGFHRYSTDRQWLVPHFEKMLYDNALLATAYLDAYQVSGDRGLADVAHDTLRYLRREMRSPDGAFFSATDADSPTPDGGEEEGWFFTWTPDEIAAAVGTDRAALVEARYGVTSAGNFDGRNVLHVARPVDEVAGRAGRSAERASKELEAARRDLYQARSRRPTPLRDDKILAAWNGLAISAFARGARVLRDPELAQVAATAAAFVLDRMTRDGRLARSYVGGEARHEAVLDDYAFVIAGLLDLYEATFDRRWLDAAITLQTTLDEEFWDESRGGYFLTARSGEALLVRQKDVYDGALPSGNAVAAQNLLRLYEITTEDGYRRRAERTLAAFAADLRAHPQASPRMLSALDFYLDAPKEILLIRPSGNDSSLAPFLDVLARTYVPNAIVVATTEGPPASELALQIPLVADKTARDGRVTAYVCENRVCALPTTDPDVFSRQVESVRPYPE